MFKSQFTVLILLFLLLFVSASHAAPRGKDFHSDVTVGGSISAPSTYLGLFTNPAALAQTSGVNFSLQGGADKVWVDPTYRAGLQAGLGFVGIGAFVDRKTQSGTDQSHAYGGIGLEISPLSLELGFATRKGINGPSSAGDWIGGLIFSPAYFVQIGITALSNNEKFDEVGAGAAVVLIDGIQIVVDGAADQDGKNLKFKPGFKIYNPFGGFSVSYGTGDKDQFNKGTSAGVFVRAGLNTRLEVAYNHGGMLPKYYGALTFGF